MAFNVGPFKRKNLTEFRLAHGFNIVGSRRQPQDAMFARGGFGSNPCGVDELHTLGDGGVDCPGADCRRHGPRIGGGRGAK